MTGMRVGIALLLVLACREAAFTPHGLADVVLAEIRVTGGGTVVRRIDSDPEFGRSVMDGIASGDSVWLEVARNLRPASAAAEATLVIALASALPHNPAAVLSILPGRLRTEDVCGIPFLRADSLAVTTYYDRAVAGLGQVRDSSLASGRDRCREVLDSSKAEKLTRIDPSYIVKNKPKPIRQAPRRRRSR